MVSNRKENFKKKILIIDDDIAINNLIENILDENDYITKSVNSAEKGLEEIHTFSPDIILCDVKLPNMDGLTFLNIVRTDNLKINVIMMTAFGEIKDAVKAIQNGASDYITKPFTTEELLKTLQKTFWAENYNLDKQYLPNRRDKNIIGNSSTINNIIRYIDIIAPTKMNVTICGKEGTGKKMFAEYIYKKSKRHYNRFLVFDCDNKPDATVEKELFGFYSKTKTFNNQKNSGILERASGGTLHLENITSLSKKSQKKLLKALETNRIKQNEKEINLDIRIISSSKEDLTKATNNSLFLKELYNKLNEFEIILPDLKDRIIDIDLLVEFFIKSANKKFNKKITSVSKEVKANMMKYSWPGNIEELKNIVSRAVLLSKEPIINDNLIKLIDNLDNKKFLDLGNLNIIAAKEKIDKELIEEALTRTGNNKSQAAKLLGFSRKTLYTKMSELEIKD